VSPGVFLAVRAEGSRRPARPVGPATTAARTGLLGHSDATRHATVLAGLRSALATAGTLDHPGGTLGHRTGAAGDDRRTRALPSRNDRRHRGGGAHRPAVTGTDTARTGHVRGAGEATGLRLVRVEALMDVSLAAGLAPAPALSGPSLGARSPVVVGPSVLTCPPVAPADHIACAVVTVRLDEPVPAGVRSGLDEPVCAGVRTGLDEGMRARTGPHRAVGSSVPSGGRRRRMAGPVTGIAAGSTVPRLPATACVPTGRLLAGRPVPSPCPPVTAPAGPVLPGTGLSRPAGGSVGAAGTTPALLIAVRDGPGLMHRVVAGRDRTGLVHGIAPTRNRTRLMNSVIAARDRTGLVHGVIAGRNRTGLVHGVIAARARPRLMCAVRAARRHRVRRAETSSGRCARRHRANAGTPAVGTG
jgi:hypothetical protein